MSFDPNAPAAENSGIFGLPFSESESKLVLLPVPWEATTSYGGGTSKGPEAILAASKQIDLYDLDVNSIYAPGIHMLPVSPEVASWNEAAKVSAQEVIENYETLQEERRAELLGHVNATSDRINRWVEEKTLAQLKQGKIVGLVGGDHASPFGAFKAAAAHFGSYGILHFDAHSDTRNAYEGFAHSHASIMHNALTRIPQITKLVQVGIRDTCDEEMRFTASQGGRIELFTDRRLRHAMYEGATWKSVCAHVVGSLPDKVWISFDIDGLDPRFCPHTGTPVAGGLDFAETVYMLREVVRSGRTILGFDLCEVAPDLANPDDEWDGNVGARLLFKLCGFTFASQGLVTLR